MSKYQIKVLFETEINAVDNEDALHIGGELIQSVYREIRGIWPRPVIEINKV